MFIVMHRESNGDETFYEADGVKRIGRGKGGRHKDDDGPGVTISLIDGGKVHFQESNCGSTLDVAKSEIFVMNESGKTVARYPL